MRPAFVPRPLICGAIALIVGCGNPAPETPAPGTPALTSARAASPQTTVSPTPAAVGSAAAPAPAPSAASPPGPSLTPDGLTGPECLARLQKSGIRFRETELPGVATPVTLLGPVGGVRYDPVELRGDCQLLLTLQRLASTFRKLGISRVRHWGGFKHKRTPSGALSLHARGLAIDIYEVLGAHGAARVKHDFVRGVGCQPSPGAVLNQLSCLLRELPGVEEVMTPDRDEAHHNHLHVGVSP